MAPGPVVLPRRRLGQVTEDFLAQLWSRQQFLNASLEDIPSDFDVTFVGTEFGEIREVVPGSDGDSGEPSELSTTSPRPCGISRALGVAGTRRGSPTWARVLRVCRQPRPGRRSWSRRIGGFRARVVRREVSDRFGASSRIIPLLEGIGAFPGIGVEAMRLYVGERG